ncbi:hypothetical protein KJ853_04515 [Patescibacteria group bacterium]|nr:hypothetical protein [Patescibacteria group bacterium]
MTMIKVIAIVSAFFFFGSEVSINYALSGFFRGDPVARFCILFGVNFFILAVMFSTICILSVAFKTFEILSKMRPVNETEAETDQPKIE